MIDGTKRMLEESKSKHVETKKELRNLIENRYKSSLKNYTKDILEARLTLVLPLYVYNSDESVRKAVTQFVEKGEERMSRIIRNDYQIPDE